MEHVTPIRHRGRVAIAIVAAVGLTALQPARSGSAQQAALEILPLAPGNTWTYDGTIWWVPRNSRRVLEERVRLEMRVVDVVERPGALAALLTGYPRDLVTPMANRFHGEFTLLQIGPTVHVLRGERAREALKRVADPSDSLDDLLIGSEIVLDLPLAEGKTFCTAPDRARASPGPCWFVRGEGPAERVPVVGLNETIGRHRYVIALQSDRAHEVRGFLPGVGFTSFAIGRFGDPSALELELIDARLVTPPRAARGLFLKTLDLSDEHVIEMASASDRTERLAYSGTAEPRPPQSAGPAEAGAEPRSRPETSTAGGESPAAAPPPTPFPSPEPLLPDRRIVQAERPSEPVGIAVAIEDLPVPVWEETRPACVDAREWYVGGAPIRIDGREFDPVGSAEPIDPDNLVPVGEFDGVPTFAGRLSETPHTDLWLPLCGTPGTYRLYADLAGG